MGDMERKHIEEIPPNSIREYTQGIAFKHIENNAVVYRVLQMIHRGELTEIEGLRLMVNTLADENKILNEMHVEMIMSTPADRFTGIARGKN